jgi:RNA polymerase sigma-70 factor (ECF subfamily)
VALWEKPLFYYIRRFVASEQDAWDALQQVWLQVVRKVGSLRDRRAFPEWVYRIARNTVVSRWRAAEPFDSLAEEGQLPDTRGPENAVPLFDLDAREVHAGLSRLKPPLREVLTLFFLEEFSIREIAGIIGAPEGTVKSRLHYAKSALRRALRDGEESHE